MTKVFVAGATGVLGRRAVAHLVAAGHDVTGVARTEEKAELLRSLGATPVTVDLFDASAVATAVAGHDVVINLATHIPPTTRAGLPGAWDENERIRRDASRNLVDAALAAGATRYVQESIVFAYRPQGDAWIDESSPVSASAMFASGLLAEEQARRFAETAGDGAAGVALRFGMYYDAESHTTADVVRTAASTGRLGLVGKADAYYSYIATDDAARAVVAALDAPSGTYNVVDDEPVTRAQVARVLSDAVRRPVRLLPAAATIAMGSKGTHLARSLRVSNAAFKQATGWAPRVRSIVDGMPAVVDQVLAERPAPRALLARVLLGLLAPVTFLTGAWAELAPRAFYDDFPGLGRVWVAVDGPYNEHLVRDFGSLNLALGLVLAVAAWKGGRAFVATAAGAYALYAVPHLVYHARHADVLGASDQVLNLGGLAAGALAAIAALVVAARSRDRAAAVAARATPTTA